ncbi:MAG: DUF2934 domain-containing protein, partial [Terriglobales bacterium]
MTYKSHPGKAQSVLVVEADVLDKMNETNASIAQRAYEIYQARGCENGADQDDWFTAEHEVLQPLAIERCATNHALRLTAQVAGFAANDLEVIIGHERAVICGIHADSNQGAGTGQKGTRIMRIVELPFDV